MFLKSLFETEKLISLFARLFDNNPTKEDLNKFFNVKNAITFRRSSQDFYITWLVLNSQRNNFKENQISAIKQDIQSLLFKLRNVNNDIVDETYFDDFIDDLNKIVLNE